MIVGVFDTVEVDVGVEVKVLVMVGERVMVGVAVWVNVGVWVAVTVGELVGVEVTVFVGIQVGTGVTVPPSGEYHSSGNVLVKSPPPNTHIWFLKMAWEKEFRGVNPAEAVTCVQLIPSGEDQTSFLSFSAPIAVVPASTHIRLL